MKHGGVTRRRLVRALIASGLPARHRGGEIVVELGQRHFRFGLRSGELNRVGLRTLLRRMANGGVATGPFLEELLRR